MKKGKILFFLAWVGALVLLIIITLYNQSKTDKFMGLTSSKEYKLNLSYPAILEKNLVLVGQEVKKGQLLATLTRADMHGKMELLEHEMQIMRDKSALKLSTLKTKRQMLGLNYQNQSTLLEQKIQLAYQTLQRNKSLLNALALSDAQSFSELRSKIATLQSQKRLLRSEYAIEREAVEELVRIEQARLTNELATLTTQKQLIEQKEARLRLYSPIDGEVGSIAQSEQSSVKAFADIIKIHSKAPEYVTGYIHESTLNDLKVGQKVCITPKSDPNVKSVVGTIESIENRVEDIPLKLKKYKIIPVWGYKVLISLEPNRLKLGESVVISTALGKSPAQRLIDTLLEWAK